MDEIRCHPLDNRYGATPDGKIWSRNNNRWGITEKWIEMKPEKIPNGYFQFTTRIDGKRKRWFVHRFVWECICGPIPPKLVINHKDKNPANNCLDNIEVMTQSENMKHSGHSKGEKNPMAKYNLLTADAMRFLHKNGWSLSDIARAFGSGLGYTHQVIHRKIWDYST